MRVRQFLCALSTVAVTAVLVGMPPVPQPASAQPSTAAQKPVGPVEVGELTTEDRIVHKQPDGSMLATLNVEPVRVKQDGRWNPVDTTLMRRPDGSFGPRAIPSELALSPGGAGPLVRLGKGNKSVALSWPGKLPVPVIAGDTATYPEVLPGVDLLMRAEAKGYAQRLVIKNAAAAKNPALRRIKLGLATAGVNLKQDESGALQALDERGEPVFEAAPPSMWDAPDARSAKDRKQAGVKVELGRQELALVPDAGLLADPEAQFPISIDPDMKTYSKSAWTKVFSGKPTTSYWNGANDVDTWAKVGYCGFDFCNGINTTRAYFQFDTSSLSGTIMSVQLKTTMVYSPSCSNGTRRHELWRAASSINSGTTWNNRPAGQTLLDTRLAPFAYSGCSGYKPLGFDGGTSVNASGLSTYLLKADYEDYDHRWDWRKYKASETKLEVKYNHAPRTPTNLHTDPPTPAPCKWCAGVRYIGAQAGIYLKATLSDPNGDPVKAQWNIQYGGGEIYTGSAKSSGLTQTHHLDLRDKNGKTITWKVHGIDSASVAGPSATAPVFAVDATPPGKPPSVAGVLYREDDNLWHGGAGVPDTFTFGSNGVTDINHFEYWWTGDNTVRRVDADRLGGGAVLRMAPPKSGPSTTLYVRSVDRAGNLSTAERHYKFNVREGNGPLAHYKFEGDTKNSAYLPDFKDDSTGVLSGTTTYSAAAVGMGLRLGEGGQMAAWARRDPVAPVKNLVRTDTSFTVSAWVKPTDLTAAQSMLSQVGTATEGFRLGIENGRWVFAMPQTDSATAALDKVTGPEVAAGWTHLLARHTVGASSGSINLFVNGAAVAPVAHNSRWHSPGEFRVGTFAGDVDEVKVWDRSLTDGEAQALLRQDNVQAAHWAFDETSGATANNQVIGGDDAVLNLGATFDGAGADNGALRLDGVDDYAGPNTAQLRTDQSFSVSAWLSTDSTETIQAAVSQDGTTNSGFALGYLDNGRYSFTMPRADTADAVRDTVLSEALPKTKSQWRHLVATYDAASGQMSLYLNGKATFVTRPAASWTAAGAFQIGRMIANGVHGTHWAGKIDDVRVYHRAITDPEVKGLLALGQPTVGHWDLDGNADPGGTLKGDSLPTWTAGQSDSPDASDLAVKLDGAKKQHIESIGAVDTAASFSVTAWAKIDKLGSVPVPTVVSQDGATNSAFSLGAATDGSETKWAFTRYGATGAITRVFGPPVQVGQWTHLVGVYSKDPGKIDLYVNGVLQNSLAFTTPVASSGPLVIGARKWGGNRDQFFSGAVDDVEVHARELFGEEITAMAGRDLALRHTWPLNEPGGTTVADGTGGLGGTVRGGATFTPGISGNAIKLDGVDDSAGTAALTSMRTDKSFTVSAWVYLDGYREDTSTMTAVSVDGVNTSKFRLGHRTDENKGSVCIEDPFMPCGEWVFEMPEADRDDVETAAALTTTMAEVGTWVHLVGVYDQPSNRMWLYVNGMRVAQADMNTPWTHPTTSGHGGVQIGRGKINGASAEHFRGGVDDPRLYYGALNHSRVSGLYNSYVTGASGPGLAETVAGHWKFDGNELDSSGKDRAVELAGTPEWRGGRTGSTLWLSGDDHASSNEPLLDTAGAFSVAGWAYLDDRTTNRTVVAIEGATRSVMKVFYDRAKDRWAVSVDTGGVITTATATLSAREDEWTHLAASYNPATDQLWLYVNGAVSAVQLTPKDSEVVPGGILTVGRAKVNAANGEFFAGGIDDLRAYAKAINAAEVRAIHNEAPGLTQDSWRFNDGTGRDYAWRNMDLTLTGATVEDGGVDGKALRLATAGAHASGGFGVSTRDSFTVSAWTKLTAPGTAPATVVSQDGGRHHGFALQYRPAAKNWAFMAFDRDTDNPEPLLVMSNQPAAVNEWVHLAGVYDHAAAQLRLYVNGVLQGHLDGVTLWDSMEKLSIGRGKVNGVSAEYFTGLIDEVQVGQGMLSDAEIATRASWAPAPTGQLGRYVNAAGTWRTASTDNPPAGYRFESSLGMPAPVGAADTKMLYGCQIGTNVVTTDDATCANGQYPKVGEFGPVYINPPAGVNTVPVTRCTKAGVHFDSRWDSCEGQTKELVLGYALGYAPMARYTNPVGTDHDNGVVGDHWSTVDGVFPGYSIEGLQGYLPLSAVDGQADLLSCRAGVDQYPSLACTGAATLGGLGRVFTDNVPENLVGRAIFQCRVSAQRFLSLDDACEGQQVDSPGPFGYLLAVLPGGVDTAQN